MKTLCLIIVLFAASASTMWSTTPGSTTTEKSVASTRAHTAASAAASKLPAPAMPRFRFESFTTASGLPDNHVYSVLVDGGRIWAGTDNGLGLFENSKWTIFRPNPDAKEHSLAHQAVLSLALDKNT